MNPTPNWQLEQIDSDVLAIVFSHLNEPVGRFSLYGSIREAQVSKLFVNSGANAWYRDGVPGLGGDIEQTALGLQQVIDRVKPRELVCVGVSMGAYAAILFGARLRATRVLALSAKTLLPVPGALSARLMHGRAVSGYEDLLPFIEHAEGRTRFHLLAGEADVVDLQAIHRVAHLPGVHVGTVPDGAHEAARALDDAKAFRPLLKAYLERGDIPADCPAGFALTRDRAAIPSLFIGHLHVEAGRFEAAEQPLRHCLEQAPDMHVGHWLLGRVLNQRRAYAEAEDHLRRAAAAAPNLPEYRYQLGLALAGMERWAEAEAEYRLAASRDSKNASYPLEIGVALAEQEQFAESEEFLREAVRLNDTAVYGWHRLGLTLARLERWTEAEAAQRQAIAVSPNNAHFHLYLGHALMAQGRAPEAVAAYAEAARINPDNPWLKENLARAQERLAA